jgi:hypothetical protein
MLFPKLPLLTDSKAADRRRAERYRDLIRREAKIGGQLFGPVANGHRREFFCLDENTWVWYEEWTDTSGNRQAKTTRYDVRPNGIIKAQDGQPSQFIELQEAQNLCQAMDLYKQRIEAEYDLS